MMDTRLPEKYFGFIIQQIVGIDQYGHTSQVERVVGKNTVSIPHKFLAFFGCMTTPIVERIDCRVVKRDSIRIIIFLKRITQIKVSIIIGRKCGISPEIPIHQYRIIIRRRGDLARQVLQPTYREQTSPTYRAPYEDG